MLVFYSLIKGSSFETKGSVSSFWNVFVRAIYFYGFHFGVHGFYYYEACEEVGFCWDWFLCAFFQFYSRAQLFISGEN